MGLFGDKKTKISVKPHPEGADAIKGLGDLWKGTGLTSPEDLFRGNFFGGGDKAGQAQGTKLIDALVGNGLSTAGRDMVLGAGNGLENDFALPPQFQKAYDDRFSALRNKVNTQAGDSISQALAGLGGRGAISGSAGLAARAGAGKRAGETLGMALADQDLDALKYLTGLGQRERESQRGTGLQLAGLDQSAGFGSLDRLMSEFNTERALTRQDEMLPMQIAEKLIALTQPYATTTQKQSGGGFGQLLGGLGLLGGAAGLNKLGDKLGLFKQDTPAAVGG